MRVRSVITRIKAVHRAWWMLWVFSMLLIGVTIRNHMGLNQAVNLWELAEAFRYPWGLIPIDILFLRNLQATAGMMVTFSFLFVCGALAWPAKSPYFMAAAVGVILFFYMMCTILMFLSARLMNTAVHDRTVPEVPAQSDGNAKPVPDR